MEERNVATWEEFLGGLEEIRKDREFYGLCAGLPTAVSWSRKLALAA